MIAPTGAALLALALFACGRIGFGFDEEASRDADIIANCPAGYTPVFGGPALAYGPVQPATRWVDATMTCLGEGTRVAVPSSRFEALVLVDHANVNGVWVGVSQLDTPGVWTTAYGMAASYLPWDSAEPNGSGDCVLMDDLGELADSACTNADNFVCECRL